MTTTEQSRRVEGSIEWRGRKNFRVRVASGTDPNTGRRRYLYTTGTGNAKAADRVLRDLLTKRDTGLGVQPKRVKVIQWVTAFIDGRVADGALAPRVESNYRGLVKHHLTPVLGDLQLHDVRTDHILAVKTAMLTAGRAPSTVKKVLGLLRQSLDSAEVSGLIARNPADAVPAPSLARDAIERRALSEDEVRAVLHAAEGTPYATMIRFAITTGLRQGEMLALRWQDIDLDGGSLEVRQALSHVRDRGFVYGSPKTKNSRRTVELSPALVAILRMHARVQRAERELLGDMWHDNDLVFPGPEGRPQWQKHVLRGFRRILMTAASPDGEGRRGGLSEPERVNWHTLRHSAASLWIKAGVDVFVVSRRLGHASPAFTMTAYAHLLPGQQSKAASALDHLISVPAIGFRARQVGRPRTQRSRRG